LYKKHGTLNNVAKQQNNFTSRLRFDKSRVLTLCLRVNACQLQARTCVVMETPLTKKMTHTESVVRKRMHLFRPSLGNSSTKPVTTVSINTIYSATHTHTHTHTLAPTGNTSTNYFITSNAANSTDTQLALIVWTFQRIKTRSVGLHKKT